MKGEEYIGSQIRDRSWNKTRRVSGVISAGFFLVTVAVSVLTFAGSPALARTVHVPGGSATIQAGIDGTVHGDTVLVADGVYTGEGNRNLDFLGKAIVVRSENGPEVTVISAGNSGRGVNFISGEDLASRLEGFTIRYGKADNGGGIYISDSSPVIDGCVILGNRASHCGGGIYCNNSSPWIMNCTITENLAQDAVFENASGGGICGHNSSLTVKNCTISRNQTNATPHSPNPYDESVGGGIHCSGSYIDNCHIHGNTAGGTGGGITCSYSTITNCLIIGNGTNRESSAGGGVACEYTKISHSLVIENGAADGPGGGILCGDSTTIIHCVLSKNAHGYGSYGGGICAVFSASPVIKNCIIRENHGEEIATNTGEAVVSFSNIENGWPGEGNVDVDPLFRDPENGDYHLMAIYCGDPYDSPCIDAGHPDSLDSMMDCWHGLGTERADMGAYGGGNTGWPTSVMELNESHSVSPKEFGLYQNYPNPFNSQTEIGYYLARSEIVTLSIFNIRGQLVATLTDGFQEAGSHHVTWYARGLSSGIYFARLEAGGNGTTIKMILLK